MHRGIQNKEDAVLAAIDAGGKDGAALADLPENSTAALERLREDGVIYREEAHPYHYRRQSH